MVPWAPLFLTVLALAALWRCWRTPSRVQWFRARQHRGNERAPPLAPLGLRAQNEARAPRPSCGGFTHALRKRTVPWALLFFTVLALAPLWCCWWSPLSVLWFRARQNRGNERAPPLAPRWVKNSKRGVRAPAKLGQLHPCPMQANGALGFALFHRACAGSVMTLVVVTVACTEVSRAPTPWERACASACATLG